MYTEKQYLSLVKSTKKVIRLTLVFTFIYFISACLTNEYQLMYTLILSFAFLIFMNWYITPDNSPVIIALVCWYLTITIPYIAWGRDGIWDSILYANYGILMISALYSGRILLVLTLVYMLTSIWLLNYAQVSGFSSFRIDIKQEDYQSAIGFSLFLIMYAVCLDIIVRDSQNSKSKLRNIISQLKSELADTENAKMHHPVSGLKNGFAFENKFSQLLQNKGATPALVYLRINNYDNISSTQGESNAVEFLLQIAKEVSKRTKFEVFQESKKELIVLVDIGEREELSAEVLAITRVLSQPINISSGQLRLSYNGGVAQYPHDGDSYKLLQMKSLLAMNTYEGEQSIANYRFEMEKRLLETVHISDALKNAITENKFTLYYQPQIDLKTSKVVGVEALIRWTHQGNFIPPDKFIRVAESNGFINQIGDWVLTQACKDCQEWNQIISPPIPVAVNLSPIQFSTGNLPQTVSKILHSSKLSPSMLELELTESVEFDSRHDVEHQIDVIKGLGVAFSIDDFGSGYSNLAYISRFQAGTLKIDRAFIQDIITNKQHFHIVTSILQIAGAFNIKVVAEGIEDKETGELLLELGVAIGQGYFWAKPMPLDMLKAFIIENNNS